MFQRLKSSPEFAGLHLSSREFDAVRSTSPFFFFVFSNFRAFVIAFHFPYRENTKSITKTRKYETTKKSGRANGLPTPQERPTEVSSVSLHFVKFVSFCSKTLFFRSAGFMVPGKFGVKVCSSSIDFDAVRVSPFL